MVGFVADSAKQEQKGGQKCVKCSEIMKYESDELHYRI